MKSEAPAFSSGPSWWRSWLASMSGCISSGRPSDVVEELEENGVHVGLLAKVLYRYGLPVAISAWLVYFVTSTLAGSVKETHDLLKMHVSEQRYYLRQLCINTAKDDVQRYSCLGGPFDNRDPSR
jgi:hypothetical protein